MRSVISILLVFNIFLGVSTTRGEEGFFHVNSAQHIAKMAPSVFKIVSLLPEPFEIHSQNFFDIVIKDKGGYELELNKHEESSFQAKCSGIRFCFWNYELSQIGTASLFKKNNQIILPRHVFKSLIGPIFRSQSFRELSNIEKQKKLLRLKPRFFLVNQHNKIIFDTRKDSDQAKFSFVGNPFLLDIAFESGDNQIVRRDLTDVVIIELNKTINVNTIDQTISDGREREDRDNILELIGFPKKTYNREFNSDGFGQYLTRGAVITDLSDTYYYYYDMDKFIIDRIDELKKYFIFSLADGVVQFSGSPAFINGLFEGIFIQQVCDVNVDCHLKYNGQGGRILRISWIEKMIKLMDIKNIKEVPKSLFPFSLFN